MGDGRHQSLHDEGHGTFHEHGSDGREGLRVGPRRVEGDRREVTAANLMKRLLIVLGLIARARYMLTSVPKTGQQPVVESGGHVMSRQWIDGRWQITWELFNRNGIPHR